MPTISPEETSQPDVYTDVAPTSEATVHESELSLTFSEVGPGVTEISLVTTEASVKETETPVATTDIALEETEASSTYTMPPSMKTESPELFTQTTEETSEITKMKQEDVITDKPTEVTEAAGEEEPLSEAPIEAEVGQSEERERVEVEDSEGEIKSRVVDK